MLREMNNIGKIYPEKLSLNDPYFLQKSVATQNLQYVSNLIRNNKRDMYQNFTYTASLIITILTAKYSNYLSLSQIFLIIGCLILLFSILLNKDIKTRKIFLKNRSSLRPGFKNLGIPWRE